MIELSAVALSGAQSLVSAMVGDAWAATRAKLAARWGRASAEVGAQAEAHLDQGRAQALALAKGNAAGDAVAAAYWAGYLGALLAEHPDLADTLSGLGPAAAPSTHSDDVHNSNTGTVHGNLVQLRDVHGNINL